MREFVRRSVARRTDFGERTSRLIFMSSSHDRASERESILPPPSPPRVVSKAPEQFLPPHSPPFFAGKIFWRFGAWKIWGIRVFGREKTKLFPRRVSRFFWGKRFFSRPNIWSHTDRPSFLPKSFFHNLVKRGRALWLTRIPE